MTNAYGLLAGLLLSGLQLTGPDLLAESATAGPAMRKRVVSLVVADAISHQPVRGVLVLQLSSSLERVLQARLSDEKGRVTLATTRLGTRQRLLRLSHPAYTPVELWRTSAQLTPGDTLFVTRLTDGLPALASVNNTPGRRRNSRPAVLQAAYFATPSTPPAAGPAVDPITPPTIARLRVGFTPLTNQAGLRVRVLAATSTAVGPRKGADLLPPIELTKPFLAQALDNSSPSGSSTKGELVMELGFDGLTMPVSGVYVVLETLARPTDAPLRRKDANSLQLVLAY